MYGTIAIESCMRNFSQNSLAPIQFLLKYFYK